MAPVALRVNPDVDAGTHAKITTGRADNKFGVAYGAAAGLYAHAAGLPGIRPVGVALHIGSQVLSTAPYGAAFARAAELVRGLRAAGQAVELVDCGGGLGVGYRNEPAPGPGALAGAIRQAFGGLGVRVAVEPGRSIVAQAGVLLCSVLLGKRTGGRRFVVLDGAMNDLLRPAMYDAWHGIVPVGAAEAVLPVSPADVVGPVCETGGHVRARPVAAGAGGWGARGGAGRGRLRFGDELDLQCAAAGGDGDGGWGAVVGDPGAAGAGRVVGGRDGAGVARLTPKLRGLRAKRAAARAALWFEGVWPAVWPAFGLLWLFVIAALLGLPFFLPGWARLGLPVLVGLGVAGLAWWGLRRVAGPTADAVDRRLEREGGVRHRPLAAMQDRPAGARSGEAEAVWAAYQARLVREIGRLRVGRPRPGMARRDGWALRGLVLVALVAAAVVAGADGPGRLWAAVAPGGAGGGGGAGHGGAGLGGRRRPIPACRRCS